MEFDAALAAKAEDADIGFSRNCVTSDSVSPSSFEVRASFAIRICSSRASSAASATSTFHSPHSQD